MTLIANFVMLTKSLTIQKELTKMKTNLFFLLLAATVTLIIYSCGSDTITNTTTTTVSCFSDTLTPGSGQIRGTVTFFDTNRVYGGGYYDVSVYTAWPPTGPPSGSDTMEIIKNGSQYTGCFQIKGLTPGGSYVTVASWIKVPYGPGSVYVLGARGCDTVTSCIFATPRRDTLPATTGLKDINFGAFIDSTKARAKF